MQLHNIIVERYIFVENYFCRGPSCVPVVTVALLVDFTLVVDICSCIVYVVYGILILVVLNYLFFE